MSDLRPHYSGKLSKPFWNKVNKLRREGNEKFYGYGILLQDMESTILTWIHNNEAINKTVRKIKNSIIKK